MLTHNDVHLLVGLLTQITSLDAVEVELGARVPDAATGTARDVDITVTARHPDGTVAAYAAIEVKDEKHALDTPTVEQLISKLNDMPSITSKSIVSSSGYTKPARAKAAHHGVSLLSLREWERGQRIYPFLSPDLKTGIEVRLYSWAEPPSVMAATDLQRDDAPGGGLKDTTLLLSCGGEGITTLAQLAVRAQNHLLTELRQSGALEDLPSRARRPVRTLVRFPPMPHASSD